MVNAYGSKEVAASLGIGSSTLRKWSLLLEAKGYFFVRDEKNRRTYSDSDMNMFSELSAKLKDGMMLEHAVALLAGRHESPSEAPRSQELDLHESALETLKQLEEAIKTQDEYLQAFTQNLSKRLDETMSRYDSLNIAIRQIAASTEKQAKQKRRKKWYQFW